MSELTTEIYHKSVSGLNVIAAASVLKSNGENPEYDRALVEMCCELLDVSIERKPEIAKLIGIK